MHSHCVIAHHREDESLAKKVQNWILSRTTGGIRWSCSRHVYCRSDGYFKAGDITGHFKHTHDARIVLFVPKLHDGSIERLVSRDFSNQPDFSHYALVSFFAKENYVGILMELEDVGF